MQELLGKSLDLIYSFGINLCRPFLWHRWNSITKKKEKLYSIKLLKEKP